MYYKIENTKSKVYQKLHALRIEEKNFEKENIIAIELKTGFKFERYLGRPGQRSFTRVTQYEGFDFINPKDIDLTIWKVYEQDKTIFVPNRKTKKGREMHQFLLNGLNKSSFQTVFDILKIEIWGKFSFPYVEIENDIIYLRLDDKSEPKDKNIIEITKKEFNEKLFGIK